MAQASLVRSLTVLLGGALSVFTASGQVNITTWQVNNMHSGVNDQEVQLTPAKVLTPNAFGVLFTQQLDGSTYGQPLYMNKETLGPTGQDQKLHNLVFVGTQSGSMYAFDADADPLGSNPNGTNSTPVWKANLIPAGMQVFTQQDDTGSSDILGNLSLTTTPVIDQASFTMYVAAKVKNPNVSPVYQQYLWALDVRTGQPKAAPLLIQATFNGVPPDASADPALQGQPSNTIPFIAHREHLRMAMTFQNNLLYLCFASHSDTNPYWGEMLVYDTTQLPLKLKNTFITTPNGAGGNQGGEGGLWMGASGPGIDSDGNVFVITGNGPFDTKGSTANQDADWGESALQISPENTTADGVMHVPFGDPTKWFVPQDWNHLNGADGGGPTHFNDADLGGGGVALFDSPDGQHHHLMAFGGKAGKMYLLDRDSLGGTNDPQGDNDADDPSAIQEWTQSGLSPSGGIFSTAVVFNNNFYYAPDGGHMAQRVFQYDATTKKYISDDEVQSTVNTPTKGQTPFISASGTGDGIVWAVANGLTAWDAANVRTPIYQLSNYNAPIAGGHRCITAKFSTPIVAEGKVYFTCFNNDDPNTGFLVVAGLFPGAPGAPSTPNNPTAQPNSSTQITVSWTNTATDQTGFTIFRSTNPNGPFTSSGSATFTVPGTNTSFIDTGLTPNTTYFYQVVSTNTAGPSAGSTIATATTFETFNQSGLVAYWNFDSNSSGTELPVSDVTNNGHDGVIHGEAAYGAGYINSGAVFHGTNFISRVVVPASPAFQFAATDSFTLSAWVQTVKLGAESAIIAASADQGSGYGIYINAAGQWIGRAVNVNGANIDIVGPPAQVNLWTHVALVQDGKSRFLYVNGKQVAQGTALAANGMGDLWMGDQNNPNQLDGFQGLIDEVRLYNTALSPSAIQTTIAPPVLGVLSLMTQGNATWGETVYPLPYTYVEPRIPTTAGTYTLQVSFDTPLVSGVQASLAPVSGSNQAIVGKVASLKMDSTNSVATVTLNSVTDKQALVLHMSNLIAASEPNSVAGTADIPFNVLQGDVTGDTVVDSTDLSAMQQKQTGSIDSTHAIYDVNSDGVVDNKDQAIIQANMGNTISTPTEANLALFKTATSSPISGGGDAKNAFDDDPNNTRWESEHSDNQSTEEWIQVDLNQVANIDEVIIKWEAADAQVYKVQVSNDGSNWTDANTVRTITGNPSVNPFLINDLKNLNATGRFVRIDGLIHNLTFGYSAFDIKVIGSFGTKQPSSTLAPSITSPATATGTVGSAFSYQIAGDQSPTTFNAVGLPTGLSVNTATGLISGTPTGASTNNITLSASNANGTGTGPLSLTISSSGGVPAAPASLTATSGNNAVVLNWKASIGATSYSVLRGLSAGGQALVGIQSNITATTFTDQTAVNGTPYFYRVTAVNKLGKSAPSNEVSATPNGLPLSPSSLTATAGNAQVTLRWQASAGATSYSVLRGLSAGGQALVGIQPNITATTFTDRTAANDTEYFYRVTAANSTGKSAPSNEVSAIPRSPL
ncbi:LamG-like jellyroll fold domain-containing protein [Granulicella sp. dw_53]|uniref:LamG-like jellyroll fold domain-containing protein n=1 Tax=Granulicella sp. dw_53 TaxID=2719792 RepID=UPI001BD21C0F|nr:LamG-like jellyroll fold domain-containing protein [Granulicella sp. dw_53]